MIKVDVKIEGDIRLFELRVLGILVYRSKRPVELWNDGKYIIF
jgi:hypothetical protein